jgi:hypothetical protein
MPHPPRRRGSEASEPLKVGVGDPETREERAELEKRRSSAASGRPGALAVRAVASLGWLVDADPWRDESLDGPDWAW